MARKHVNAGVQPDKGDLPTKVCAACGRPFSWRRKWARDWNAVRFCSDKCRAKARQPQPDISPGGPAGRR